MTQNEPIVANSITIPPEEEEDYYKFFGIEDQKTYIEDCLSHYYKKPMIPLKETEQPDLEHPPGSEQKLHDVSVVPKKKGRKTTEKHQKTSSSSDTKKVTKVASKTAKAAKAVAAAASASASDSASEAVGKGKAVTTSKKAKSSAKVKAGGRYTKRNRKRNIY